MRDRDFDWLAALTGIAFILLLIVGFVIMGEPPDSSDPVQKTIDFYKDNDTEIWIGVILQGLAATALVFYAGYLRKVLRAAEGEGHMLSTVALAGATILAVGATIDATISVALVETVDDVDPAAVQALAALWNNDFIPLAVGALIFLLAAGLSIIRHGALPAWLGWVAILIAVVSMTPIGFIGFMAAALWIAITSIMLSLRARSTATPGPASPGLG